MQGITSVGHVAIKVTDLDRSLDFYINKLGFPEMLRLHKDDGSTWLVYLRITDSQYLEVFPGAENDRAPGWNANGINHMCLTVDNIDEVLLHEQLLFQSFSHTTQNSNNSAWIGFLDFIELG